MRITREVIFKIICELVDTDSEFNYIITKFKEVSQYAVLTMSIGNEPMLCEINMKDMVEFIKDRFKKFDPAESENFQILSDRIECINKSLKNDLIQDLRMSMYDITDNSSTLIITFDNLEETKIIDGCDRGCILSIATNKKKLNIILFEYMVLHERNNRVLPLVHELVHCTISDNINTLFNKYVPDITDEELFVLDEMLAEIISHMWSFSMSLKDALNEMRKIKLVGTDILSTQYTLLVEGLIELCNSSPEDRLINTKI